MKQKSHVISLFQPQVENMFSSAALLCGTDRLMRKLWDGEKNIEIKRKKRERKKIKKNCFY
jgi:hypothetical protein